MVSNAQLTTMLEQASSMESAARMHLAQTKDSAAEQARGQAAYRHAVALRKALEDWKATRAFRQQLV